MSAGNWGGGGMMGPMGGGPQAGQAAGLTFAGIPPEYADQIDALLDDEEDIPVPDLPFDHVEADRKRFTLRSFLLPHWPFFAGATRLTTIARSLRTCSPRYSTRWPV